MRKQMISVTEMTLTVQDIKDYVRNLPEGSTVPHPNNRGDEDGLLGAALRAKYGIPESQAIWDSTQGHWLEIFQPGVSVSGPGHGYQIWNAPEVRAIEREYFRNRKWFTPGEPVSKEKFLEIMGSSIIS